MNSVNQTNACADGDIVGRDKITKIESPKGKIEKLLLRLKEQYDASDETKITIEELARYHLRRAQDGIEGLENKLIAASMYHYYDDAIEKRNVCEVAGAVVTLLLGTNDLRPCFGKSRD